MDVNVILNLYGNLKREKVIYCSINTRNMETLISSEMISQQTICGEIGKPNKDCEFLEIAKEVPWTSHNDNAFNQAQHREQITEIEQTKKN